MTPHELTRYSHGKQLLRTLNVKKAEEKKTEAWKNSEKEEKVHIYI